jgi:membrane-associated phospholipid phosphatase
MFHSPAVRALLVVAMLAPAASSLSAQSVGRMLENDVKNAVGDIWSVWTSPLRGTPRDWLIFAGTLGASAAVSPLDDDVDRWMVRNRDHSAWSALAGVREGGFAFTGKTVTPIAIGALAFGLATKNQRLQEGLFGCLAAYGATSVVRNYVLYSLVSRTRPDSSRGDPVDTPAARQGDQYDIDFPGSSEWGRHSLPAGHATNVVACASFLGNRFSMGIAEPVIYIVAAGVGIGRLVDRRHWTSDTVLGWVFGYAVGRQIAHRSGNRAQKAAMAPRSGDASFYLTPGMNGLTFGWQRSF